MEINEKGENNVLELEFVFFYDRRVFRLKTNICFIGRGI